MLTAAPSGSRMKGLKAQQKRRRSIIEDRRERLSESFQASPGASALLTTDPESSIPRELSQAELRDSFDEWMKIVADNKINASNSWKLELIDYFHDLTVLKEGDSINFQKASCTLDGCVKIYTSRVDSVDSETKKLLSGLIDQQRNNAEDDEQDEEQVKVTKKREHRQGNTLEKDITNLDLKKLDTEFTVDPLFRKTSADFDEGGARGLLLNHLSIASNGQIIFDASDALTDGRQEDAQIEKELIDMYKLKDRFEFGFKKMWSLELCWPLKDFEFTNENQYFDPVLDFNNETTAEDLYQFGHPSDEVSEPAGDNCDYDFGYDGGDNDCDAADYGDQSQQVSHEYAVASIGEAGQENIFSYFDTAPLKNWAGPEHWRSRPLRDQKTTSVKKTRAPKVIEYIDFVEADPVDMKALFAKGSGSISMAKADKSDHLLPDDIHFSSKDLLKLFTNPEIKMSFRSKTSSRPRGQEIPVLTQGPIEMDFWNGDEIAPVIEPEGPVIEPDNPFEFFDPFGDDDSVDDTPEEHAENGGDLDSKSIFLDYGDQLVEQPKKVFSAPLQYAKTAKRVDVKKLKENIWKELTSQAVDAEIEEPDNLKLESSKSFSEIVKGLDDFYPEKKRSDISVAFCFICVLHLANEQNLKIESTDHLQELMITQPGN